MKAPWPITLEVVASLCSTLANRLVEVKSCCLSRWWSCSRAASCELLVLVVAVSKTFRIISEVEQLWNRAEEGGMCSVKGQRVTEP